MTIFPANIIILSVDLGLAYPSLLKDKSLFLGYIIQIYFDELGLVGSTGQRST